MLERLKRLLNKAIAATSAEAEPESFDYPRPQRVNPDPPARDWFARVRARSDRARAVAEARALEALDFDEPHLSDAASQHVDELFAKIVQIDQSDRREGLNAVRPSLGRTSRS